jgi:hypothetical protein
MSSDSFRLPEETRIATNEPLSAYRAAGERSPSRSVTPELEPHHPVECAGRHDLDSRGVTLENCSFTSSRVAHPLRSNAPSSLTCSTVDRSGRA